MCESVNEIMEQHSTGDLCITSISCTIFFAPNPYKQIFYQEPLITKPFWADNPQSGTSFDIQKYIKINPLSSHITPVSED